MKITTVEAVWISPSNKNNHRRSDEVSDLEKNYYSFSRFVPDQFFKVPNARYVMDSEIPKDIRGKIIEGARISTPPDIKDEKGNAIYSFPEPRPGLFLHKDLLDPISKVVPEVGK